MQKLFPMKIIKLKQKNKLQLLKTKQNLILLFLINFLLY